MMAAETRSDETAKAPARLGQGIPTELFLDCVHCGLCTSACPTYLETGDENNSPRGRIYLMRSVADGRLELTPQVERHLDLCLDCRSCETACPSGVQYGRLIEPFRVEMRQTAQERGRPVANGWFQRGILYGLFPYPGRLRWSLLPMRLLQSLGLDRLIERWGLTRWLPGPLQRMHRLLPRLKPRPPQLPEVAPPVGPKRARVALFTGCVAEALFPEVHAATVRVLQANGCEVVIPRGQACCGAIHYHSGAGQPALELARQNVKAFAADDCDAILVNVAGCGSMLKDYAHLGAEVLQTADRTRGVATPAISFESSSPAELTGGPSAEPASAHVAAELDALAWFAGKVQDVSEFLAELGPIAPRGPIPLRATYHDACHLGHAQRVKEQPRQLLSLIPELTLVELAEAEICCGAAGSYNLTEPEMADRLAARKCGHLRATGADVVVSGNAGCTLQLQATLRESGEPLPVVHPVQLLDWSYRGLSPADYEW